MGGSGGSEKEHQRVVHRPTQYVIYGLCGAPNIPGATSSSVMLHETLGSQGGVRGRAPQNHG